MKLYLDVDGVINAQMPPWSTVETERVIGYRIRWAPVMLTRLDKLGLDLVWLTTWGSHAPYDLAPVIQFGEGAPAPVAVPQSWGWTTLEWKLPGLQALEPEDHFVWIDDHLVDDQYGDFATQARAAFPNALIIAPKAHLGITQKHLDSIVEYMEAHNG